MKSIEYRFIIDGLSGSSSKGVQYQARPEMTTTGIRWTITGDLAAAIHSMIEEARAVPPEPERK